MGKHGEPTHSSLALQSHGCALPMTIGTAWPAAPWMAASHYANWCLPPPPCCMSCGATPVASPTSPGPYPMTFWCLPPWMLPCVSGLLRMAAVSGRFLTLMAPSYSAAPSSPSTTTSLWSDANAACVPWDGGARLGGQWVESCDLSWLKDRTGEADVRLDWGKG